jgi:cytochrome c553
MIVRNVILPALLALASGTAFAAAPDAAAGQTKAQPCAACHGPTGNESVDPTYPRLAGQYADYLAKALRDYKTGARKNAIMAGFATTLSEQDIADLAAFFAAQKGELEDLSHLK